MRAWTCGNCRARDTQEHEILTIGHAGPHACVVCGRVTDDVRLLRTRDAIRIIGLFIGDLTEAQHKAMGSTRVDGRVTL